MNKSFYPVPTSSIELADVEVMKPPTAARIDPPIEVAIKELVDKYRRVRQRTMRSETTKYKAGALPPAVYCIQPPHYKVMFHDDATVEGREGMEQIMPQVTDDDGDSHAPSITFVDDSTVEIVLACVAVVSVSFKPSGVSARGHWAKRSKKFAQCPRALTPLGLKETETTATQAKIVCVGEVSDQEDEYDTDSGNDMDDDDHDSYPDTTTLSRSGRAICAHFRLDL